MNINDIINMTKISIENSIKGDSELNDTKIDYILINPKNNDTISLISNGAEKMVEFTPFTKEMKTGYATIPEWDYNFDEYLFKNLEKEYKIGYISDDTHYNIWNYIQDTFPESIEHKDGVQKYLQFCADNKITKEYLDKKTKLDTPDIMKYFEGLYYQELMFYKGYVIKVDDINHDNSKEVFVDIYKCYQDYIDLKRVETISLKEIGLKKNIMEYIDDKYIDKVDLESEKSYLNFILGYDLLHDMIKKYGVLECDINFEFCNNLVGQFLDSKEYSNFNNSSYTMLQEWLDKNKDRIERDYMKSIGFEDKIYNGNLKILEKGFRRDEPIALVEKDVPSMNSKEYIVAFHYTIDEATNNLSWCYGRYYYDKKNGQEAYKKVINGGTLDYENCEER